jgi:adenine-specific DNA-methyltransferase
MKNALANFQLLALKDAARQFLATLGYKSDRFIADADSKPQSFLDLFGSGQPFDPTKALVAEWKSADFLFQLTDEELSRETSLFVDTSVNARLLKSYVFIAIELKETDYARGKFSAITRQINRLFPMPVMVFFRHQARLTIAVINRRVNKLDENKDVLGKVTLISGIDFAKPHRGHLDILDSLALQNLVHPQKKPITDFDTLHASWEQIFNVELLNERFYRELANWYFWALPQVEFPNDTKKDSEEKHQASSLIRLLTRLIFCWFLKEKNLIPEKLFHPIELDKILKGFDPESETSSTYYQAILQNLFFATLNQRMGKDGNGKPYRVFATDEGFTKNRATYDVNNLYRYETLFRDAPDAALAHFADIPFLNGGLFECLDRTEDDTDKKRYLDGFSRNAKKRPHVPDRLFFDSGETADLSVAYGDTKRKKEKVTGLITILNRYKFTIVENTPIDQEIALDPELLGKVFENLLASYNDETKTTARKQTGSFYTPRPIVDYMVDESLKAHLTRALVEEGRMKEPDARAGLDLLFAYTEKEHAFTPAEVATLIAAIDALKILDPACGSGAFPMGVLHKLVYILGKLDPANERWKHTQLTKLDSAPMREELERAFADNNDDYGRKLYLIENCLYGVDIQPIAIQISKLRFFISLVCDQKTNRNKKDNHGIRPLPNLETKFVAADTLIGLPDMTQSLLVDPRVGVIEKEIESLYHSHFSIQRRDQKLSLQRKIKNLRQELAQLLAEGLMTPAKSKHVADWDAFDPQSTADFFDPHWMFGRSLAEGFDIVIGNPPYISVERFAGTSIQEKWRLNFTTYASRADIYCFFYERGINLLRKAGILAFISSNKFQRAGYGTGLRRLIASQQIHTLIDFCELPVFAAATDPMIVILAKGAPIDGRKFPVLVVKDETEFGSLPESVAARSTLYKPAQLKPEGWSLEGGHRLALVEKLRAKGIPLSEYVAGEIMAGIKTGFNKAFWIEVDLAQKFRSEDKVVAKRFLKPLLLGDDARRWFTKPVSRFLIYTPRGTDDAQLGQLKNHMAQWRDRLSQRALDQEWYELQQAQLRYSATYEQDKIVYPDIALEPRFSLDADGRYPDMTAFSIPSGDHSLVAFLNSSALWFFLCRTAAVLGDADNRGRVRCKTQYVSRIPIPPCSVADKVKLAKLAEQAAKSQAGGDSSTVAKCEREIDVIVYRLFDLTPAEIGHIEASLVNTRGSISTDESDDDE